MRLLMPCLLIIAVSLGCRDTRPKTPDWVASAPVTANIGISFHLGWVLENPESRKLITQYPMFEQAIELFLDSTEIDPVSDKSRVSLYVLENHGSNIIPVPDDDLHQKVLLQIAGIRDPKSVQRTIVETFPPDGSLRLAGRECPLFVVMDISDVQISLLSDGNGRLWIGDMAALQEIDKGNVSGDRAFISRASEWISPASAMQGFWLPESLPELLSDDANGIFANLASNGLKGLAWSVTPLEGTEKSIALDLVVTGTEDAVSQLKPWMQRAIALVSSLGGDGASQPETIQENNRIGIRCQFEADQFGDALRMLNLSEIIPYLGKDEPASTGKPE